MDAAISSFAPSMAAPTLLLCTAIDANVFLNAPTFPAVLTSSTYPALPTAMWVVGFDSGGYVATFGKDLNHRVRLVRGGDGFGAYDSVEANDIIFQDGFDGPPT